MYISLATHLHPARDQFLCSFFQSNFSKHHISSSLLHIHFSAYSNLILPQIFQLIFCEGHYWPPCCQIHQKLLFLPLYWTLDTHGQFLCLNSLSFYSLSLPKSMTSLPPNFLLIFLVSLSQPSLSCCAISLDTQSYSYGFKYDLCLSQGLLNFYFQTTFFLWDLDLYIQLPTYQQCLDWNS